MKGKDIDSDTQYWEDYLTNVIDYIYKLPY